MVTACNLFTEDHMLLVKARRKAIVLLRRTIIFFKFGPFPVSFWVFFGSLFGLQLTNFSNGCRKKGFTQLLLNIDIYILLGFPLLMSSTQFTILFVRRIVDNDMKDMGFLLAVYLVPI